MLSGSEAPSRFRVLTSLSYAFWSPILMRNRSISSMTLIFLLMRRGAVVWVTGSIVTACSGRPHTSHCSALSTTIPSADML